MYQHTQRGYFHLALYALAGVAALFGLLRPIPIGVKLAVLFAAVVFALIGASFATLHTRVDRDAFSLGFGPLPWIRRRIPLSTIEDARVAQSSWVDGWGIHWVPGRGWTWNLWGFDCVELRLTDGFLRVGTDDAEGLAATLQSRLESH